MVYEKEIHKYDDLLDLPHPTSKTHKRMPTSDRAAQFSPFAALTGYEDALDETGRLTEHRKEMSEDEREDLDRKLAYLETRIGTDTLFTITRFVPDSKKEGGSYETLSDTVQKLNPAGTLLTLRSGIVIEVAEIVSIDCRDFQDPDLSL